jgi:hypothetical protein
VLCNNACKRQQTAIEWIASKSIKCYASSILQVMEIVVKVIHRDNVAFSSAIEWIGFCTYYLCLSNYLHGRPASGEIIQDQLYFLPQSYIQTT